jgi:hypothetical protein
MLAAFLLATLFSSEARSVGPLALTGLAWMSKPACQSGDETRPIIKEIKYTGLKHATLHEINTLTGLRLGGVLDPKDNQHACLLIAEHLNKMGRPFATVDLVKGGKEGDDTVEFSITEGPKVQIREVEFTGNSFVSAGVLRTHLSANPRSQTVIAADIKQLVEYYRSFGFQDVLITHELKWTADCREATVIFHIEERNRSPLTDQPRIESPRSGSPDELDRLCNAKPGKPLADPKGTCEVVYQVEDRPVPREAQIIIIGNEKIGQVRIITQVPLCPEAILSYPDSPPKQGKPDAGKLSGEGCQTNPAVVAPDAHDEIEFPFLGTETLRDSRKMSLLFGGPAQPYGGSNADAGLIGSIVLNERHINEEQIFLPARDPLALSSDWECAEVLDEVRVLRDQSRLFGGPGFQQFYMVPGFYR